jgi:hypothetical protein
MDPSMTAEDSALVGEFQRLMMKTVASQSIPPDGGEDQLTAAYAAVDGALAAGGWNEAATSEGGPGHVALLGCLVEAAATVLPTPAYPLIEVWSAARAVVAGSAAEQMVGRVAVGSFGAWLVGAEPSFPRAQGIDTGMFFADGGEGAVDLLAADLTDAAFAPTRSPDRTLTWCRGSGPSWRNEAQVVGRITRAAAQRLAAEQVMFEAAELLGLGTALFNKTKEYASQRIQFGRPIASFQTASHRLVDQFVHLETLRSLVGYASWVADADADSFVEYALLAKGYASENVWEVANTSIQLHGAIGFTFELGLQFPVGRIMQRALAGPTGEECYRFVGDAIVDRKEMLHLIG